MEVEEQEQTPVDGPDPQSQESSETPGEDAEIEREDGVDLKKMADEYAKYLIVNSKQDVRHAAR